MLQMSAGKIAGLSVMWPRDRPLYPARHSCLMSAVTSRVLWPSAIWLSMGAWFAYPGPSDFMRGGGARAGATEVRPGIDEDSRFLQMPRAVDCLEKWEPSGRSPEPAAVPPTRINSPLRRPRMCVSSMRNGAAPQSRAHHGLYV